MTVPERTAVASHIAAVILSGVVAVCAGLLTYHGMNTISQLDTALATVNHVCAPGPCGTLAIFDKTLVKTGDAVVTTQTQELAVMNQAKPVLASLGTIAPHVNETMDALTTTANAATDSLHTLSTGVSGTLSTANTTLGTLNATIATIPPLTGRATLFIADADTAVKNAAPIEANATEITASFAVISKDGQITADRFTFPPKTPWYKKIVPVALKSGELAYDFIR